MLSNTLLCHWWSQECSGMFFIGIKLSILYSLFVHVNEHVMCFLVGLVMPILSFFFGLSSLYSLALMACALFFTQTFCLVLVSIVNVLGHT